MIALELLLLIDDPWRIFLTTDHPNGAPFFFYPHLIRLLMDKGFRDDMLPLFARSILHTGPTGLGLLPWGFWLSASLPATHHSAHWDLAWSGFDVGLAACFCATAIAAHRRRLWFRRAIRLMRR